MNKMEGFRNGRSYSFGSGMPRFGGYQQQQQQPGPDFSMPYHNQRNNFNDFQRNNGMAQGGRFNSSSNSLPDCNANTNLIVNYLPQDMTEHELYIIFRNVGPIESCRVIKDFKTGYSFGYAFVNYQTETDARKAIAVLNGVTIRNKRLKVSFARPGGDDIKDTNLYVTNLPKTINEDDIDNLFGKFGTIVQKNILRDKNTGIPRGVAFVRFNKREEAQAAIKALNNFNCRGSDKPLGVKIAEEHGKAKANSFMPLVSNNLAHRNRQFRIQKQHPYGNRN